MLIKSWKIQKIHNKIEINKKFNIVLTNPMQINKIKLCQIKINKLNRIMNKIKLIVKTILHKKIMINYQTLIKLN